MAWDERASIAEPWAAGLQSEYAQTQRFLAALRHLNLGSPDSILDFGCGSGRLVDFLPANVTYYAYDWSERFRDRVRSERPAACVLDEFSREARIGSAVAIGPFNLSDQWSKERTRVTIEQLWRLTLRTVAVSLLRQPLEPGPDDPSVLRYDPAVVAEWAVEMGASRYAIDCSYLDNDMLLVLKRT